MHPGKLSHPRPNNFVVIRSFKAAKKIQAFLEFRGTRYPDTIAPNGTGSDCAIIWRPKYEGNSIAQ